MSHVPVWIASLPDVVRVRSVKSANLLGADILDCGIERKKLNELALTDDVREAFAAAEVNSDLWEQPDCALIYGLGLVKPWFIYDHLRSLGPYEKFQREYWSLLSRGVGIVGHCFFFKLLRFLPCSSREPLPQRAGRRSFITELPKHFTTYLMQSIGENQPLPDWATDTHPRMCVQLPRAWALMLTSNLCDSFSLCELGPSRRDLAGHHVMSIGWSTVHHGGSRHLRELRDGFPPLRFQPASLKHMKDHNVTNPRTCSEMLDIIRDAVDPLIHSALRNGDDLQERVQNMHSGLSSLQFFCDEARVHEFDMHAPSSKCSYSILTLINAFWACQYLKSDHKLRESCIWMLKLTLPKSVATHYCQKLQGSPEPMRLPSASTITRTRGRIDVAWMIIFRKLLHFMLSNGGVSIYPMVDSSPQGNRNYEIVIFNLVRDTRLNAIHSCITQLDYLSRRPRSERIRLWQEEAALMRRIHSMITRHKAPSVQLPFGKENLKIKFQTTMHAFYLLSPSVAEFCELVGSAPWWVSDQGTEIGLARVQPVPVKEVFPYMDVGVNFPVDAFGEVDFTSDSQLPGPANEDFKIDLTDSLEFNGTLHAVHNAGRGLELHCQHYKEAVFRLGRVSQLISSKRSKDRLSETCFADGVGAQLFKPLSKYKTTCYVERWGTVAHTVLETTDDVEAAMRWGWDLQRYLRGSDNYPEMDPDTAEPDTAHHSRLDVVNDSVNSAFWCSCQHNK